MTHCVYGRVACLLQPCPEGSRDFRSMQCAVHNKQSYKGRLYTWIPHNEPTDPCVLHCQAKSYGLKVVLGPTVLDGTRCRNQSQDMCINGRCRVGLDVFGQQKETKCRFDASADK